MQKETVDGDGIGGNFAFLPQDNTLFFYTPTLFFSLNVPFLHRMKK